MMDKCVAGCHVFTNNERKHHNSCPNYPGSLSQVIAELEAENRIFRSTESVDDSVWDALLEQVRTYQAKLDVFDEMDEMLRICLKANVSMAEKLDRVRGLPEKWREDEDACAAWEHWRNGADCADELQSALGDDDE